VSHDTSALGRHLAGLRAGRLRSRLSAHSCGDQAMNLTAPDFISADWWAMGAMIALSAGMMLILLLELLPAGPRSGRAAAPSLVTVIAAAWAVFRVRDVRRYLFGGMFVHDGMTVFFT